MAELILGFKASDSGRVWLPIIADGVIRGFARKGCRYRMELFRVAADGLHGEGVFYLWSDLKGISITGGSVRIHSDKYLAGGIQFVLDGVVMKTAAGDEIRQLPSFVLPAQQD